MSIRVIEASQLDPKGNTLYFSGERHGDTGVSFILVNMPPGDGARLHKHPYDEVFVMHEGSATFTLIEDDVETVIEAKAGQIIVVKAGVAHKFVNTGDGPLRQVDIHVAPEFSRVWLED